MPFGLTNAVPAFQRVMNEFIDHYKLKGVNVYLDNITVGGMDKACHEFKCIKGSCRKRKFYF